MFQFEFAAASVIGRDHREAGRNNEDATIMVVSDHSYISLVADGCGSSPHSEVGAKVGLKVLSRALLTNLPFLNKEKPKEFFEIVREQVLRKLKFLVGDMDGRFSETVRDYFLFTVVGSLITEEVVYFFHIGDGTLIINGEFVPLGPYPNNEPPYLSYGMVSTTLASQSPEVLEFQLVRSLPTSELKSFLIGSDGVQDLIRAKDLMVPGKDEPVGSIDQFWSNDRYFKNSDALRRRLFLVNRDAHEIDWQAGRSKTHCGRLPDDTTIVVGRQRS